MKFSSHGGSPGVPLANAQSISAACVVAGISAARRCRIGRAGNGDAMLAYHLMDFSRYFFDQSDIGRTSF